MLRNNSYRDIFNILRYGLYWISEIADNVIGNYRSCHKNVE